ncbi:uncharacterized protein LOC110846889 [Folsomia candida]|uniref:uncharacterized protein LOC110846889 n=1 Tax=Folsomia candida TaxID=158441 RepID=UPI001604DB50|nr:uncharacterized protein LOC110846889 [Folsomia candida]
MDLTHTSSTEQPFFNSPEDGEPQSITTRLFHLAMTVDRFYTPFLFLFGLIGNCLTIIVFSSKSQNARGSLSSSVYLSALAISDSGYLINLLIMWLDNVGWYGLLTNSFMCKTVMYTATVTGFLSVQFVVCFTLERFVVVCYPLFKPSQCTASRAKKIVLGLSLTATLAFSYILVIADVQTFRLYPEQHQENSESLPSDKKAHESMFDLSTSANTFSPGNEMLSNYLQVNRSLNVPESFQSEMKYGEIEDATGSNKQTWANNVDESTKLVDEQELVYMCSVPEKYHKLSRVNSYVDSILTFILPFLLIAILNLKIIFCVKRVKGHRESMLANTKIHYRQSHKPQPISGPEGKAKLKDFFTTFHYIKKSAGGRNQGRKKSRRAREAADCQNMGSTSSFASCSNSNCPNSQKRLRDLERNGSKSLLKHNAISIEMEDSQSSPGEVTPPFKPIVTPMTPTATEIRVTKTLLLVSSVFLLLHFPSHCIRVAAFIESIGSGSKETLQRLNVAQHWANILFNTNFAINFLLYCCSGKAFRRSIKNLFSKDFFFRKACSRSPGNNASTTMLTTQLTLQTDSASCKYNTRIRRNLSEAEEEDRL